MPDNELRGSMERRLLAEARIRERNAWPPGPLHERAATIFNEWAAHAASANPQSDTWSSSAFFQDRKEAALKEAKRQLLAESAVPPMPVLVLSRAEKKQANSVAVYLKAIKTALTEGTITRPDVERALRGRFGGEFYLTNFREAWKETPPAAKAAIGRPRK